MSAPRELVADWVRLGLVALAVPQFVTGAWALVDPSHWFDRFPGFDPRLVAAEPPFNEHLAVDAGAGFLATAVVLLLAARWGDRRSVVLCLVGYATFALPHLVYHAANPAPRLSGPEDAVNVLVLAVGAVAPAVLLWGAATSSSDPQSPASVETGAALTSVSPGGASGRAGGGARDRRGRRSRRSSRS